jgi:hypothetical protein
VNFLEFLERAVSFPGSEVDCLDVVVQEGVEVVLFDGMNRLDGGVLLLLVLVDKFFEDLV